MDQPSHYTFDIGNKIPIPGIQLNNFVRTTRYTILSFIPLTLLENFQRFANIYFLLMGILSFTPWSPISPFIQISPLIFVILMSMVKSGVEDLIRYFSDLRYNSVIFYAFRRNYFRKIKSQNIRPGDLIKIKNGDEIPADIVILATSEESSECYINEVNLNGETAIKQRKSLFASSKLSENEATEISGSITIPIPCKDIQKVDGSVNSNGHSFPFSIQNCILRGVFLRHTSWVIGLVLYTGHDTRIIQNQRHPPHKSSHLEKKLNQYIIFDFILNLLLVLFLSIMSVISDNDFLFPFISKSSSKTSLFFENFAAYAILLSYMIPVALYVALELVRLYQRWTFSSDLGMYCPSLGYCQPNNSNLNEELGQIDHVFSDKTGTLTENKMKLVKISAKGIIYDVENDPNQIKSLINHDFDVTNILTCLSLCHSVIITSEGYSSESPDEEALINKISEIGATLIQKIPDQSLTVKFNDQDVYFKHLATIPFTSTRKRMSIIVEMPNGKIILFSKGADSIILNLLSSEENIELKNLIQNQVNSFAEIGLRTLVCGWKELDKDEYFNWKIKLDLASINLENREENMAQVGSEIEHDLMILGSVAIEDELQPNVAETVAYLTRMDIRFWVLTGDKKETAISIARSTNVILPDNDVIQILKGDQEDILNAKNYLNLKKKPVFIISPEALQMMIQNNPLSLVEIGNSARSVVCFRMSPFLKSQVVDVVRSNTKRVCLAIGDGANDVNMIQTAHVGIGIFGREGHQAAITSDFAITRFKHLKRLLCCHGRLSLIRLSGVILIMSCKNILLIFPQIWFAVYTNFSPTTLYDSFLLSTYNLVWTLFPPAEYGWFEQDLSFKSMMTYPYLYKEARAGRYLSLWRFGLEFISVTYQSVIVFLINIYFPSKVIINGLGRPDDLASSGFTLFVSIVIIANLQLVIRSHGWNVYMFLCVYMSIFVFFLFTLPYGSLSALMPSIYFVPQVVFTDLISYFQILISVLASLSPEAIFRFIKAMWFPSYSRIIRENELLSLS